MQPLPERIATLEERVLNIQKKLEEVSDRVDEIYVIIQRGKGAKWVVLGICSVMSGFVGVIAHKLLPM